MNEIIDRLTVHNVGGVAEHIDCYARPFFLVNFCELESGEEHFVDAGIIIPIKSYTVPMMANESIGFRSGEMAHIYANENLQDIVDNIKQWEYSVFLPEELDKKIVQISIGYLLEIDCQDLFQNEWTEYYACFPGYNATYGKFPNVLDIAFDLTKISEENDRALYIVKTCFGDGEMVENFIYENGRRFDENYIQFFNIISRKI